MANPPRDIRILVVDDDPGGRGGGRGTRCDADDWPQRVAVSRCRGRAGAVETARRAVDAGRPFAVICLDLGGLPDSDGLRAGEQIRRIDPHVNFMIAGGAPETVPGELARRIPPGDKLLWSAKPFRAADFRRVASALGAQWRSEFLLRRTNARLAGKVSQLEDDRRELMRHKAELEALNDQLLETNNALTVLARNLEHHRRESARRVAQRTRAQVFPIIQRLKKARSLRQTRTDLERLDRHFESLTAELGEEIPCAASLSGTEQRVAAMIKNGMASREIAGQMRISLSTVKTHRKNIRRKLNLHNSRTNLASYLADWPQGVGGPGRAQRRRRKR